MSISIESCYFNQNFDLIDNSNCHGRGNVTYGGGLSIMLELNSIYFELRLTDCKFENNAAIRGGAMSMFFMGKESNIFVSVEKSEFISNSACFEGGAILIASDINRVTQSNNIHTNLVTSAILEFHQCNFISNRAELGGGVASYINGCSSCNSSIYINMTECQWMGNSANSSGFAIWLSGSNNKWYWTEPRFHIQSQCRSCIFVNNTEISADYDSSGTVMVDSVLMAFVNGFSEFFNNTRSALVLRNTAAVHFAATVVFRDNKGIIGGAILLYDNSSLYVHTMSNITFAGNEAFVMGGAIYSMATRSSFCIFQFDKNSKINISFHSNTVHKLMNQSIFVENAGVCGSMMKTFNSFSILPYDSNQVRFPPSFIELVLVKLKQAAPADYISDVALGEKFSLKPMNILDRFDNKLNGSIGYIWVMPEVTGGYKMSGPDTITFDDTMNDNNFMIEGHSEGNGSLVSFNVDFYYSGEIKYHVGTTVLSVNISACKLGYYFLNGTCHCRKSPLIKCVADHSVACIKKHYWFANEFESPLLCPVTNCDYDNSDYNNSDCPIRTRPNANDNSYCCLNSSHDTCKEGRGETLCSECVGDYSFTFGGLKCVTSCKYLYTVIIVVVLIVYWIMCSVFFLMVLSLDLSVGSGFMYGIVYYFSVITIYTDRTPLFGKEYFAIPLYISTMLTQLNPEVLGFVEICFVEKWKSPFFHLIFRYATPFFIVLLIFAFVIIKRNSSRLARSTSNYSPIHAICMLILFSYTSMSCTSFKLLIPTSINNKTYVKAAPTTEYFRGIHWPVGILAICVELFLSLPICILLLFAPKWTQHVNLVRLNLKQFIDEFQACFHSKHRWFAGFYFLTRLCIFLVHGVLTEVLPQHNSLLTVINVITFTTVILIQPYKQKWLNLLDSLLLMGILLVSTSSLPFSENDQVSKINKIIHQYIFPAALTYLPTVYLLTVSIFVVIKRLKQCSVIRTQSNEQAPPELHTTNGTERSMCQSEHSSHDDYAVREPLLDASEEELERKSYGSSSQSRKDITSTSVRLSN